MVLHETYRAADGGWLTPEEVERVEGGKVVRLSDKTPVEVGRSEKMSKSKKNVVDPDEIIRGYGADTARWFMSQCVCWRVPFKSLLPRRRIPCCRRHGLAASAQQPVAQVLELVERRVADPELALLSLPLLDLDAEP